MIDHVDVLIVGGGFSGIALASQLVRTEKDLHVVIARSPNGPKFGVAYDTDCVQHLLNVPAKGMSAFPEIPNHFIEWAHEQGNPLEPNSFASRRFYRSYLEALLKETLATGQARLIEKEVTDICKSTDGWQVEFTDGSFFSSSQVVIAFGGFPPSSIPETKAIANHPSFVANPWRSIDPCRLAYARKIAIIGTGLTAIDVILSCESAGFDGSYTLFSRRGRMPAVHDLSTKPLPQDAVPQPSDSIRELLKSLRKAAKESAKYDTNWRAVVDGMRPRMAVYWQTLSPESKRRFLSHLRPFWEVHRHRLAPEIHAKVQALIQASRLTVRSGKLSAIVPHGDSLVVTHAGSLGDTSLDLSVDMLFNCTGPTSNIRSWPSLLIQRLISASIVETDPFDRGINCNADGKVQPGLYVLGHLRRGMLWESTAVPELRVQAANLSKVLIQNVPERVR